MIREGANREHEGGEFILSKPLPSYMFTIIVSHCFNIDWRITWIKPNVRGAPWYAGCTPDIPKMNPMHMPNHTLEDPMHGMQPSGKKLDFILISPPLLSFQLH